MNIKFAKYLWSEFFTAYDKKTDPNKDANGQGTQERFMEVIGQDMDDNIVPKIEDMQKNMIDPRTMYATHLAYAESDLGYEPEWTWFTKGSIDFRRRILRIMPQLLTIRGTRKAHVIMFSWLNLYAIVLEDFGNEGGFDSPDTFDSPHRTFDSGCPNCYPYRVYLTVYNPQKPVPSDYLAGIETVLIFNQPVHGVLQDVTYAGLSIANQLHFDPLKFNFDFSNTAPNKFGIWELAVLADGGSTGLNTPAEYPNTKYLFKQAKLLIFSGGFKLGFIYGMVPATGAIVKGVYTRPTGVATIVDYYRKLVAVPVNMPRLTNPAQGAAYLFEPARTNEWSGADTMDGTVPLTGGTVAPAVTSILAGNTVLNMTVGAKRGHAGSFSVGDIKTISCWMKPNTSIVGYMEVKLTFSSPATTLRLRYGANVLNASYGFFEVSNNLQGLVEFDGASVERYADDWHKCHMTFKVIAGTPAGMEYYITGEPLTGSDSFYVTCPQMEDGYPSSYIPAATGLTGFRDVDHVVFSGLLAAGITSPTQGTLALEAKKINQTNFGLTGFHLAGTADYNIIDRKDFTGALAGEDVEILAHDNRLTAYRWQRQTKNSASGAGVIYYSSANTGLAGVDSLEIIGDEHTELRSLALFNTAVTDNDMKELSLP